MVDIHCHLLYGVDDGPKEIAESVKMLESAAEQGVTHIILTPHYRRGMFRFDRELAYSHMEQLKPYASKLGIELHLGTEVYVNGDIIEYLEEGKCLSLAGSEYVLTEYEYDTEYSYIFQMSHLLMRYGYIPVIAHVERYGCLVKNPKKIEELQEIGALIQVNAGAVIGEEGWASKNFCKKLLKHNWVDIVASDSHGMKKRVCYMAKAYDYISDKFGERQSIRLMLTNPDKILQDNA